MDLLHNLGLPSKQCVRFKIEALDKYLVFDPRILEKILRNCCVFEDSLSKSVQNIVKNNSTNIKNIEVLQSFMIAKSFECDKNIEVLQDLNKLLEKNEYEICEDINMLITVFCKTVGDLFIPNREYNFDESKFNRTLLFLKSEVFNSGH